MTEATSNRLPVLPTRRFDPADRSRPAYHFTAPVNWLNDPNGLCQWDGIYHMFYQLNPFEPIHGQIHWGHATSVDLLHWTDQPIALAPGEPEDADSDGCWSGVLVDDHGTPTILYTGLGSDDTQLPCLATGSPDLVQWQKYSGNPVLQPPKDLQLIGFRDHCVWRQGDTWQMLIGAGIRGVGGTALLYTSADLRQWTYQGPITVGDASVTDPVWTGTMWECVDLFRLGSTDVLVFSAWDAGRTLYPLYLAGQFDGRHFSPGPPAKLDLGNRFFYAPQTFSDERGRRIALGWAQEGRTNSAGWSGVMSLPRELGVDAHGRLTQRPAAEVESLRGTGKEWSEFELAAGQIRDLGDLGDQVEVLAHVAGGAGGLAISVLTSPDGAETTTLIIDAAEGTVELDRSRSSLDRDVDREALGGEHLLDAGADFDVRILIDHSIVEIFVGNRCALTARVYPTRSDAVGASIAALSGVVRLLSIESWPLAGVWTS